MRGVEKQTILSELKAMKERMETLFIQSFTGEEDDSADTAEEAGTWEPPVDIWETAGEWVMVADLPGVQDEDLQVELAENQLTIEGKRETIPALKQSKASLVERREGRFYRSFAVPDGVLRESIRAKLKSGVLTITCPKDDTPRTSSRKVEVKSG